MLHLSSVHSPRCRFEPISLDTLKEDLKIYTRPEFKSYKLDDVAEEVLRFLDKNRIFEYISYFNQRSHKKTHYILISPFCKDDEFSGAFKKFIKPEINIMRQGRYVSWSELRQQFCRCDLNDLSNPGAIPKGKIAIDKQSLAMLSGSYTHCGISWDQMRPSKEIATKQAFFDELKELEGKGEEDFYEYLHGLVVFDKRNLEGQTNWSCEVITYSDRDRGLLGSHSSIRLISPRGDVISAGWWRYDDLSSKANQRGILHCPDPIELKLGQPSCKGQKGPIQIFCGELLNTETALKMLAEILFLHRHPGLSHHYSISNRRSDEIGAIDGINCANFILQLMQICLPLLRQDQCSLSVDDYLALSCLPNKWEAIELGVRFFNSVLVPFSKVYGVLCRPFLYSAFGLNGTSSEFEKLGGRALIYTSSHLRENLGMVIPELISRQLQQYQEEMRGDKEVHKIGDWHIKNVRRLENR